MHYDVIIIGGGPAGLSAAIYAVRGGLNTLVVERAGAGGQLALTPAIENYPGIKATDGFNLANAMREQAESLGAKIKYAAVTDTNLFENPKKITASNVTFTADAVILCMGAVARKLGVEGEKRLTGAGISYCAVCDGNFFKGKHVAIVGGGNTAIEDAAYLATIAKTVTIVHRRDRFRASAAEIDKLKMYPNILYKMGAEVLSLEGESALEGAVIKFKDGHTEKLDIKGLFVADGKVPDTELTEGVKLDGGYILTDETMATNIGGVFAAGDIRKKGLRQVVTAAADGAIAADSVIKYLKK